MSRNKDTFLNTTLPVYLTLYYEQSLPSNPNLAPSFIPFSLFNFFPHLPIPQAHLHPSKMPSIPTIDLTLPPLSTLVCPSQILHLFRHSEPRAAYWQQIFAQLWDAAAPRHHHFGNDDAAKMRQQRAHQKLASLTRIVKTAKEKQRAARRAKKEAAALQRQSQISNLQQGVQNPPAAMDTGTQLLAGGAIAPAGIDFVELDLLPLEQRSCTMCKHAYCVHEADDGEVSFRHYPVQLSCAHLVCFGCAKVLIRMFVNCVCCGASSGDGKAELARIEAQIQSCGQRLLFQKAGLDAVGVGNCDDGEAQGFNTDATRSDGVAGKGVKPTREDVEAALTLLNLAGKNFSMEDIDAGLALLDLQADTDMTLEDYLLMSSRQSM